VKFKVLALSLLVSGTLFANPAADVVKRLQASYEKINTIEAKFDQTYRSARFDEKKAKGKVVLAKPGKMRWDYSDPKGRVMVADGKTLTMFDPEDRQALVSEISSEGELPVPLSFLWGKQKIADAFESSWNSKGKILTLIPKKSIPNVTEVQLTLKEDGQILIMASRVIDALGGESELRFSDLRLNKSVSDKTFAYEVPQGIPKVGITKK
jgi:outer membrane lipoprotein carrier protein